ncbi:MAG: sugar transferase [Clostridium sp.]|nr:sugar transferase [Clostridium sp.]
MKRIFDIVSSLAVLIILLPLIILISIIIKVTSKGPVIFIQKRVGQNNKIFNMYKFRTMKIDTPEIATHLLKDSEKYVTRFGKILRKTSLDELPQLINIIKGDMSVVGPRPALYNQYDLIKYRTELGITRLVPGLTGWAQINGRDELSIEKKVNLEKEYLEENNIFIDFKIILLSVVKVIKREGIK